MVGYVATGIIFAVLESPKSFTGTRHVRSCLIIILNIAAREHPRAGSKQMATYQAVVAQTQSSRSSSNLCCSVATQTWSAHHVVGQRHTACVQGKNHYRARPGQLHFFPAPLYDVTTSELLFLNNLMQHDDNFSTWLRLGGSSEGFRCVHIFRFQLFTLRMRLIIGGPTRSHAEFCATVVPNKT